MCDPRPAPIGDEVSAAFAKYNRNGDGLLDLDELRGLLEDAHFQVDDSYVDGLAGLFGTWDSDGSGGIEEGEFRELWGKLGLGELLAAAAAAPPRPPPAASAGRAVPSVAVTCTGTIREQGPLGLELADTIDPRTGEATTHIQKISADGLAGAALPDMQVGMLIVSVNGQVVEGMPYDTVVGMLGSRPVEIGLAPSPHNLPAAFSSSMATIKAATKWKSKTRRSRAATANTLQSTVMREMPTAAVSAAAPMRRGRSATLQASAGPEKVAAYTSAAAQDSWARQPEPEPELEQRALAPGEEKDRSALKKAAFDYFKGDDEMLSETELSRLLDAADYAANGSYIEQALAIFGKFDEDGSSAIDFPEFSQLWDYLQLDDRMKESGMEEIILGESDMPQTSVALFNKYDTNHDGVLDQAEVTAMMADIGYEADEEYISGTLDVFGQFDTDGGGSIGMAEFPALWKHLAPDKILMDHTMDASGMDADQMFSCLQKFFRKYDPLRSKQRLWETVSLYNTPQKFQHLCSQLFGKYGEHPVTVWKGPEQLRPRDAICEKHVRSVESQVKRGEPALRDAEELLRTMKVEEQTIQSHHRNGAHYVGRGLSSVERSQHRVEVTFDDPKQPIGLNLISKWIDGVRVVSVKSIKPRSLAARVREVTECMTIERIDGTKVDDLPMDIIDPEERMHGMLMRRPVTVIFGAGGAAENSAVLLHAAAGQYANAHGSSGHGDDSDEEDPMRREQRIVRTRNQVRAARELGAVTTAAYDLVKGDEHFLQQVDSYLRKPAVQVTFTMPGNLGLIFTAKDANSVPVVASIEANSLAADFEELEVGLELTHLQGKALAGKAFREVIGDLKAAECPMTLQFKHAISISNPREKRLLKNRPYRSAEPWAVRGSAGSGGVVVRSLPSNVASALGRATAKSIVQVVGREGDWLQIEWAGARQSRMKWENKASAEGDDEKGWVQLEDRASGKVYLERASGAAFFNLGQSTGNVESKAMPPEQLERVVREMRAVAQQDSDAEMTRLLGAYAEAAKGDGRLDRAWQELRAVRSAKRAEDAHQAKLGALQEHQARLIKSGREATQAGNYAHRAWREQSWAERERAVASSLLS